MFSFAIVILCLFGITTLLEVGSLITMDSQVALGANVLKIPVNIMLIIFLAICIAKF